MNTFFSWELSWLSLHDDADDDDDEEDEDNDEDEMLRCWTDVTHVDEYSVDSELSWLSLHDDVDDDDEEEDEDDYEDDDFGDEDSRHDVLKFKSELNDDGDDDDISELMHLEGDELT